MSSPTQRSLIFLRQRGYTADVIERWIPRANVRKDWGGFGDILACKPSSPILLVQTTSASNMSARYRKILGLPAMEAWLLSGGAIVIHGWGKFGARGKQKRWECKEREITMLAELVDKIKA